MFSYIIVASIFHVPLSLASFLSHEPLLQVENTPSESTNRKSLLTNKISGCTLEDLYENMGLSDLQQFIQVLAVKKSTTAYTILKTLQKRIKQDTQEPVFNYKESLSMPHTVSLPLGMPSLHTNAMYDVPSNPSLKTTQDSNLVFVPVQDKPSNRLSSALKADYLSNNLASHVYNRGSPLHRSNEVLPDILHFLPIKINQQPLGATVRVNWMDPLNRDVVVAVSPLMSVLEALQQADIQYRRILNQDTDVFTFAHSSRMDCPVIVQINGMTSNEEYAWKITITHREVVYNNFCLPSGSSFVKPGTLISLSYVPF